MGVVRRAIIFFGSKIVCWMGGFARRAKKIWGVKKIHMGEKVKKKTLQGEEKEG